MHESSTSEPGLIADQVTDARLTKSKVLHYIFMTYHILYFAGLRGAIAFALSINLDFEQDKRHVLITTTLIIVLFTVLCLGGSTLPILKVGIVYRKFFQPPFISSLRNYSYKLAFFA